MPVARSVDDPKFDLGGNTITGLASPSRGASETMMYRIGIPAGSALPLHSHDHEEVFHVLSGSMTSVLGDEEHDVRAGDTVIIPAGLRHRGHTGAEPAVLLVAMPTGTMFVGADGGASVPPWGE